MDRLWGALVQLRALWGGDFNCMLLVRFVARSLLCSRSLTLPVASVLLWAVRDCIADDGD